MDDILSEPIQIKNGINLCDILNKKNVFHIDTDFHKQTNLDEDFLSDPEDDSDREDAYKNLESDIEKLMISTPDHQSFQDLATKMLDCDPSGAVKILVIEEGNGPLIPVDAEVTIHYAAYWEKATIPFDSTLTMNYGSPLKVTLGRQKLLPGLELGLTMVKGPTAKFHLLLQPSAAWGEQGVLPRIKPEPCLFTIAVYEVVDTQAGLRFNDLPKEEQSKHDVTVKTIESLKTAAKDKFQKKKYMQAIKMYQQCINVLNLSKINNDEEFNVIKQLKTNTFVNLAVCYYKVDKPKYVIAMLENLSYIIDINTHCKAMFYLGRANEALGKSDEALVYYRKALKLEPRNKEIGLELASIDKKIKEAAENEKKIWQNAFESVPVENNENVYDVDEDFKDGVQNMCQEMAGRDDFTKFDLPDCLTTDEIGFIQGICSKFDNLKLLIDGEGKKKKVSLVKKR